MNKLLALTLMIVMPTVFAGEARLTGSGRVLSEPDYVELSIQVQSKCYPTPKKAREANDEAARAIVDFLNKHIQGEGYYNKVITTGGYTSPFQVYHRDRILCEQTFQKHNSITIRTQQVEKFEALYDDIQKEVYNQFSTQPMGMIENSVTFVTMSSPMAAVSQERRDLLENRAITMALNDAKGKLKSLFIDNPLLNLKVTEISEMPIASQPQPMAYRGGRSNDMMAMSAEKMAPAPVQFDEQWIQKQIYFRFVFDDVAIP